MPQGTNLNDKSPESSSIPIVRVILGASWHEYAVVSISIVALIASLITFYFAWRQTQRATEPLLTTWYTECSEFTADEAAEKALCGRNNKDERIFYWNRANKDERIFYWNHANNGLGPARITKARVFLGGKDSSFDLNAEEWELPEELKPLLLRINPDNMPAPGEAVRAGDHGSMFSLKIPDGISPNFLVVGFCYCSISNHVCRYVDSRGAIQSSKDPWLECLQGTRGFHRSWEIIGSKR